MPYKIFKKGSNYKVCKKDGKKCFSKKPISKKKASAQLRALYSSESIDETATPNDINFKRLVEEFLIK